MSTSPLPATLSPLYPLTPLNTPDLKRKQAALPANANLILGAPPLTQWLASSPPFSGISGVYIHTCMYVRV